MRCINTLRLKSTTVGFTLIEVLVAISILTTVLFAPLAIITQYLTENLLTENNVKAHLLAQEVIEYVRYDRDSDLLTKGEWFENLKSRNAAANPYNKCVMEESAWAEGNNILYCDVQCRRGSTVNDCGNNTGFVSGVYQTAGNTGTRPPNAATCDGAAATYDFVATVTILIPPDARTRTGDAWYASVKPCVSWKDKNDTTHKVELEETLFRWLERK